MAHALDVAQCAPLERRLTVAMQARDTATLRDVLEQLLVANPAQAQSLIVEAKAKDTFNSDPLTAPVSVQEMGRS